MTDVTNVTNHSATEFTVRVGAAGRERRVSLRTKPNGKGWDCTIDGEPRAVDIVEAAPGRYSILLEGRSFEVHAEPAGGGYRIHTQGHDVTVEVDDPRRWAGAGGRGEAADGHAEIIAPMPGKVVRVLVEEDQEVAEGEGLIVIEAMKMQNEIRSPKPGVVEQIHVRAGDTVELGMSLMVVA